MRKVSHPPIEVAADALFFSANAGEADAVEILLQRPDVRRLLRCTDTLGNTALHLAAQHGHVALAKLLVEGGASVRGKSNTGATPFELASENGHVETAHFLNDSGGGRLATMSFYEKTREIVVDIINSCKLRPNAGPAQT